MKYNYAVYVGRYQPFHNEHKATLDYALTKAANVIIVLGSYKAARNIKNPWTAEEREIMIRSCYDINVNDRLHFVYVRDHFYSENKWIAEVQNKVYEITGPTNMKTCIVGYEKDDSSYYLHSFPQWNLLERVVRNPISATDIRNDIFSKSIPEQSFKQYVPKNVFGILCQFIFDPLYAELCKEYDFIQNYKKQWENSPYQPTFVTTDAVVVRSGHVLVIKRKFAPGKGLWALPGGFVNPGEKIIDSAIRELKEETKILFPVRDLYKAIKEQEVFDYPDRSLRGRTITHAYFINLGNGELPQIKGADDAEKAKWMTFQELYENEDKFYEDHHQIIQYFINKV